MNLLGMAMLSSYFGCFTMECHHPRHNAIKTFFRLVNCEISMVPEIFSYVVRWYGLGVATSPVPKGG